MLQGLRKPVNDLSRGALVDDIVYTIALTAIQAMQQPEECNDQPLFFVAAGLHSKSCEDLSILVFRII
jgi:hypothetical protein